MKTVAVDGDNSALDDAEAVACWRGNWISRAARVREFQFPNQHRERRFSSFVAGVGPCLSEGQHVAEDFSLP